MNPVQLISLLGAFLVLAAFASNTFGWMNNRSAAYQLLNLLGALGLGYAAVVGRQYGFILLQTTWALVSLVSLVRLLQTRAPQPGV
ncbi:hypothetical protein J7643_07495 [bacterium]|nr:hypothetical protein [bacterium]